MTIPVPDGWEMKALFNRLIREGYADYNALKSCSMRDIYNMLHMLEWNDHAQAYAAVLAKANK